MLGVEAHQAVGVVNDVTPLVLGLKGDGFVWECLPVNSKLVKLLDQLLHHLDIGSVGPSTVEGSVPVIEDDGAFSLEGHTLLFKMCQVDSIFVPLLEPCDELWSPLISPGLVFHGVDDKHSLGDGLALVACEPVWED